MFLTKYSANDMRNRHVAGMKGCHRDVTSKRFVATPASVAKRKLEPAGIFDDARSTSERSHRETSHLTTE